MPYLEVNTLDGYLQLDDAFKNTSLIASGSVVSKTALAMNAIAEVVIDPSSVFGQPMIAVSYPGLVSLYQQYASATEIWWRFAVEGAIGANSLRYWIFDLKDDVVPAGLFTVWDAAGDVVFDSAAGYAKTIDFVSSDIDSDFVRSYQSSDLAVVFCSPAWYRQPTEQAGGGWRGLRPYGASISGNTIRFRNWLYRDGTPSTLSGGNRLSQIMVLDVAGM